MYGSNLTSTDLVEEGKSAFKRGDFLNAAHLLKLLRKALRLWDALTSAEMRNNSSVAYLRAGMSGSVGISRRLHLYLCGCGDLRRQGWLWEFRGCARSSKSFADAEDAYHQSADLLGNVGKVRCGPGNAVSISHSNYALAGKWRPWLYAIWPGGSP